MKKQQLFGNNIINNCYEKISNVFFFVVFLNVYVLVQREEEEEEEEYCRLSEWKK
jgi:hypothetical protein